jgi:hypothetical protein
VNFVSYENRLPKLEFQDFTRVDWQSANLCSPLYRNLKRLSEKPVAGVTFLCLPSESSFT